MLLSTTYAQIGSTKTKLFFLYTHQEINIIVTWFWKKRLNCPKVENTKNKSSHTKIYILNWEIILSEHIVKIFIEYNKNDIYLPMIDNNIAYQFLQYLSPIFYYII